MARENPNTVLAKNLRRIRAERHLSQEQLAELVDLHRTYIGAIERRERNVTLNTLEQIADALGVSCAQLLTPLRRQGALNEFRQATKSKKSSSEDTGV